MFNVSHFEGLATTLKQGNLHLNLAIGLDDREFFIADEIDLDSRPARIVLNPRKPTLCSIVEIAEMEQNRLAADIEINERIGMILLD